MADRRGTNTRTEHLDGVLVVGGGYAGVHAALAARRHAVPVTVLDPTGTYDFLPRLASVAGGTLAAGDAMAPLEEFVDVVRIGRAARVTGDGIELDDGHRLTAAAIVLAAGSESATPPIPGLRRAFPLRTASEALALREAITGAEALVVIGGGATGVQLAGAAAAARRDLDVTIVERSDGLLSGFSEDTSEVNELGRHAERILRERDVTVRTGRSVTRVTSSGVALDDGSFHRGIAAWTAGLAQPAEVFGIPTAADGRIELDAELRVAGRTTLFAAGDVALHVDDRGAPLPRSAQVAVRAGTAAGHNAARAALGRDLRSVSLAHQGWVLDLGGGRGVAEFGPFPVAAQLIDRFVPLLHGLIDAKHLHELGGLSAAVRFRANPTG